MNVGDLDRRIRIEQFSTSQNAFGEPVKTWAVLAHVAAHVEHLEQPERFNADSQEYAEDATKFTIRHRSDVDVTQRVLYRDNTYRITGTRELDRRRWLEVMAVAEVG